MNRWWDLAVIVTFLVAIGALVGYARTGGQGWTTAVKISFAVYAAVGLCALWEASRRPGNLP
jgi:hypothetical protein